MKGNDAGGGEYCKVYRDRPLRWDPGCNPMQRRRATAHLQVVQSGQTSNKESLPRFQYGSSRFQRFLWQKQGEFSVGEIVNDLLTVVTQT